MHLLEYKHQLPPAIHTAEDTQSVSESTGTTDVWILQLHKVTPDNRCRLLLHPLMLVNHTVHTWAACTSD